MADQPHPRKENQLAAFPLASDPSNRQERRTFPEGRACLVAIQFGPPGWRGCNVSGRRGRAILLASVVTLLLGCALAGSAVGQVSPKPPAKTPEKAGTLEERVKDLESKVQSHDWRLRDVRARVASDLIEINCNRAGFYTIQAKEHGMAFMLACEKVEPYLEGHRLVLSIGNPYSVAFRGISAQLLYGKGLEDALTKNPRIDISTPEDLNPGSWLSITVIVNPSKPEELRELYIQDLTLKTVSARRGPNR